MSIVTTLASSYNYIKYNNQRTNEKMILQMLLEPLIGPEQCPGATPNLLCLLMHPLALLFGFYQ